MPIHSLRASGEMICMRLPIWITACLAAFTFIAVVPRPVVADDTPGDIVIGEFGSLTGGTATFGTSTDEGVQLAIDQVNAAGGVLGRQVKIVVEDDQSKTDEAVTAVQKLINEDKVIAILGEVASSRTLAAAPIAQRDHIPLLSPSSTNPKVTQVGNYIFRACFIDPFQGAAMANFATGALHFQKFAVFYDVANDYSVGLKDFFSESVKKVGGSVVSEESYKADDTDFRAQLTNIKNSNPDAIYVPGYYGDVALICRQARDLGITCPLLGGDGWDSDKLFSIGRDAVNGCYFTNHYSPEENTKAAKDFIAAYEAKYGGKVPDSMAILGYDSAKLMCDAITRAGSTKGKAIRDALAHTKDFPGASGNITIDKNRNAEKPIVMLKIEDDKAHYVATVPPPAE
jgi:branched-chain amino acid transport system substrate-binding protein